MNFLKTLLAATLLIPNISFGQVLKDQKPAVPSHAISSDIDFSPKNFQIEALPGGTAQGGIIVKNKGRFPYKVKFFQEELYLSERGASVNSKAPKAIKLPSPNKEDISVSADEFDLKPGEEKRVILKVRIPKEAKEALYFKYSFRPTKESLEKNKKEGMHSSLSFFATLMVAAKVIPKGVVTYSLDLEDTISYDKKTKALRVNVDVKNNSTSHLSSLNGVGVILKDGKNLGKLNLNSSQKNNNFYPKTKRLFQGFLPVDLKDGNYEIVMTFSDPDGKVVKVEKKSFKVK